MYAVWSSALLIRTSFRRWSTCGGLDEAFRLRLIGGIHHGLALGEDAGSVTEVHGRRREPGEAFVFVLVVVVGEEGRTPRVGARVFMRLRHTVDDLLCRCYGSKQSYWSHKCAHTCSAIMRAHSVPFTRMSRHERPVVLRTSL